MELTLNRASTASFQRPSLPFSAADTFFPPLPQATSDSGSLVARAREPLLTRAHDESERNLAIMVRQEDEWFETFPAKFRTDIEFLARHPSGQNLKTHHCMGVAHTYTFKTADHTRVTPHTFLAAEIAIEMANHLQLHPDDARDVVAALAGHDQGHIFASHQSEAAINSFPEFDGTPGRPLFCHERRTKQLFDSNEFARHFGEDRTNRIKSILYDPHHPLHLLVDWADRLAYLLADSLHLGHQDIIDSCHIRNEFIQSLCTLPDQTIGFSTLDPVLSLINARDILYDRVSIGRASALFTGFLTEAYHRVVSATGKPITEFVNDLVERSTPEARKLFLEADIPRLYCPQQHPALAKPVDLDYRALCHVTLDMLSHKGRAWAIDLPPLTPETTTPACINPRANLRRFEHHVRSAFSQSGGPGFLERSGAVIGLSHMPSKQYHLRTLDRRGAALEVHVNGREKWEFFIGVPSNQAGARGIHQIACDSLVEAGLIHPECVEDLRRMPSVDFFSKYH
jgi:hypothetical protein